MFYSQFILAKKGPLGTIWIAAHLEGKLRKHQVADTNITTSVDSILFPEVPIALRLSGHLLLGVVRIYSRKVNYLFNDCSEALVKIKQAFQSSAVDLPPEASKVPFHSITLPETFDFDEFDFTFKYDSNNQASSFIDFVDHNVSARDLITLQEQPQDYGRNPYMYMLDERFPTGADPYSLLYENSEEQPHQGDVATSRSMYILQDNAASTLEEDVLPPFQMDDKMDTDMENIGLFQDFVGSGQDRTPPVHLSTQESLLAAAEVASIATPSPQSIPEIEKLRAATEQRKATPLFMEFQEEFQLPVTDDKQERKNTNGNASDDFHIHEVDATPLVHETPHLHRPSPSTMDDFENYMGHDDLLGDILGGNTPALKVGNTPQELAPPKKTRRKRKLFDGKQIISSLLMKKQLTDTSDLRRKRRKNPSSEFEVWRLQGCYHDQMFERPSFNGSSAPLIEFYNHVLKLSNIEPILKARTRKSTASMNEDKVDERSVPDITVGAVDNYRCEHQTLTPEGTPMQPIEFSPLDVDNNGQENTDLQDAMHEASDGAGELYVDLIAQPETELTERNEDGNLSTAEDFEASVRKNDETCDGNVSCLGHFQELDEGRSDAAGMSISPAPETIPEKLDFLEDTKDRGLHDVANGDTFLEDANMYNRKKGKPNQVYVQNGWSVRTKAVASYLKSIFEKVEHMCSSESQQPAEISLDELLKGRTRKEAARMYFETLVLKSRDYLHVEQNTGFAEIRLSATQLLRKEIL